MEKPYANDPIPDPSRPYYYVDKYRAEGRAIGVIRIFMEHRSRYFAALSELSERLGVVNPTYVSVADEVVGFQLPKDAKVPKGYLRDNAQGRARGANGPVDPNRVFPSDREEKKALRTIFERLGRRAVGEVLNQGLGGQKGPFSIPVQPAGRLVATSYQLQAIEGEGEEGNGWWITIPRGMPVPFDSVLVSSYVHSPEDGEVRSGVNPGLLAAMAGPALG